MAALARRGIIRPPRGPFAFPGTKPGFDPGHVASSGTLISCVAHNGTFLNTIPGVAALIGTVNGGGSAPVHKIDGKLGPSSYTANNGNVSFTYPNTNWSQQTIAVIYVPDAITSTNPRQLVNMSAAGNSGMFPFVDTTGVVTLSYSNTNILTFSPVVVAGAPYFIAVSSRASTAYAGVMRRLDTGQVYQSSGTHAVASLAGDATLYAGNRGVNTRQSIGSIAAFMHSPLFMSVQQLLQWSADPWAFWYPR
jgi:hypothetical protein